IDSLNVICHLDSNEINALKVRREAFMQLTASLRDSLGRAAVVLGYAHATHPTTDPAGDAELGKLYEKIIERLRKQDDDWYSKQVMAQLSKPEQKLFKRWLGN
ncbi:MAG TPA: hypothetical protein VHW65_10425, partial [Gemmatimonadales bacterium]|nr:hypothetical protein [Gemmatimonadales bacterium]